MIVGLQIGKEKSIGLPGKNTRKILGRHTNEYSLIAAKNSRYIEKIYVSTDSPFIKEIGKKYGCEIIDRPDELATSESLTEDVLIHAYEYICEAEGTKPEFVVLLFCNVPTINPRHIDKAIEILRNAESIDSVFSVVEYNMFSPTRARRISKDGTMEPFCDLEQFGELTSIRDSQGDVYFCDLSIQVLRARCLEDMDNGVLPFKWQGRRSYALKTDFGFDIDKDWQIPVIEYWLLKHGFTEDKTPYD